MSAPADDAVRRRALDPSSSFIVQAPAGSGKTELLTRRVLTLLTTVEEPEEILAITFTRKAASEMRERVIGVLARAADHDAPAPGGHEAAGIALARTVLTRDRERGWALLRNPQRLALRTIDALATQLAHRLPVVSALGAPSGVVEDARPLYREVASRFLDEHLDGLDLVMLQLDNRLDRAQELLAVLLAKRDQWQRYVYTGASDEALRAFLEQTLGELVAERLAALCDSVPSGFEARVVAPLVRSAQLRLALADAEPEGKVRTPPAALLELQALPTDAPDDAPRWRAVRDALLTGTGTVRKSARRTEGCPTSKDDAALVGVPVDALRAHKAAFLEALACLHPETADEPADAARFVERLDEAARLPLPRYADEQWALLAQLLGALPALLAELQVVFAEHRVVDFVEMAARAQRALGTDEAPTDLALAMDLRLRHLLVDEFQDTSRSQFALFERLVRGWTPGDGRTFFAVGDPMQSIYRFRDGDVALFGEAQARGIGEVVLEPLTLEVSFRAAPAVVNWINETFSAVFPAEADPTVGAVTYSPSHPHLDTPGGVEIHPLVEADEATEAATVASLAGDALALDETGTVAILLRGRSHAAAVFEALRRAGIDYRAIDMDLLGERAAVRDLLALTLALRYPHDRLHWLAVLRSPCAGLTLDDLHVLMADSRRMAVVDLLRDDARLRAMSDDGRVRARHLLTVLEPAVRRAPRESVMPWVEACWLRLGGPAVCADAVDRDAAERCLVRLQALESEGKLYQRAVLSGAMDALYAAPGPDARVQVMTLHKAKGLEFDTVILPALQKRTRGDGVQLLDWFEAAGEDGAPRLLLAPIEETGLPNAQRHGINLLVRRARQRCDEQEVLRLLYVACTRAKHRLHLVARATLDASGELGAPQAGSLLAPLWPRLAPTFQARADTPLDAVGVRPEPHEAERSRDSQVDPTTTASTGSASTPEPVWLERLPAGWTAPAMPLYERPHRRVVAIEDAAEPVRAWTGGAARDVGTVVHRQLQRLSEQPSAREPDALAALPQTLRRQLGNLGVPATMMAEAVARAVAAVLATLDDERGRWLLQQHAHARSEWALSVPDLDTGPGTVSFGASGAVTRVVIDRTFVDEAGKRWIVDYKTGDHEGADPEGFLDREQRRYREQLDRYAAIIARTEQRPVRVGLYFPMMRGWREWEPGDIVGASPAGSLEPVARTEPVSGVDGSADAQLDLPL